MIFKYNNHNVYYEIHGEGAPLLLLNGIMMSTKSWSQFVEPLSSLNQLILVDFLDQGQSSKLEGESFTHQVQIEMIASFIDYLGLEEINLFGVSYGGEIAIQLAYLYPDKFKKLLLFNTCAKTSYWLEEVGNAWNAASGDGLSYYLTTIPFIYSPKFFVENAEWMKKRKEILVPLFSDKAFIDSMIRLTNSSVGYDAVDELSKIKSETLIVGCEYDFVTPYYQQEQLHALIENSQLLRIPESGHAVFYEKPSLFVSLVLGFVNNSKSQFTL